MFRSYPTRPLPLPSLRSLLPALLGLAVLSLSNGCATTSSTAAPPTALQSFDSLYAGAVTAESLAINTTTAAVTSKLISPAQGQQILSVTDAIQALLAAANAAAQLGNTATANANLAKALGSIAIISACLTAKPLTVATFGACTAKLTAPAVQS
jgi:hypothetical protein